ncbi:hypothetical protein COU54_05005 [Candidatus Pacearchaeota archaeon CG10_big_fil_rev_8_21_14_0_10_31_24]|nr:MAG: hypothetical protein COU54_05005 [Candidatus Pacearchaeota archaeon CG10_big_fil_rev_8_21_14_0_10_31_24]
MSIYSFFEGIQNLEFTQKDTRKIIVSFFLKAIKYNKIGNSVLMMNTEEVKRIIPLFKKYKIKIRIMNLIMP